MDYCKIKGNKVEVTIPQSVKRLKEVILQSAMKNGALAETRCMAGDAKEGEKLYIDVTFPEGTEEGKVKDFCGKVSAAIDGLIALTEDLDAFEI